MSRVTYVIVIAMIAACLFGARAPITGGQFDDELTAMRQQMSLKALQSEVGPVKAFFSSDYPVPSFLKGDLAPAGGDYLKTAQEFMAAHRGLFGIDNPRGEFYIWTQQADELGYTHLKLQQKFDDITVKGKQIIFHFDETGALYCISGQYMPTPDIETEALVMKPRAEEIAKARFIELTQGNVAWMDVELQIVPFERSARLAWVFTVQGKRIDDLREIHVDARNGEIFRSINLIQYDGPVTGSGTGVNGATRTLQLYQTGGSYKCIDATKPMFGTSMYDGVIMTKDMGHGELEYAADTSKPIVSSTSTTISDPAGVDGHYFFGEIYDFYYTELSRNSFDNSGHNIKCYVHLGTNYNNAFWQPAVAAFFFGDGDGTIMKPITAANDVCCHEFQHAVTEFTAALEYRMQSGALNEAYSDIAASCFDPDWEVGEDMAGPGLAGGALRFMDNPHAADPPLPASMAEFEYLPESMDNGGVHINMSISSLAFVRMVDSYLGRERGWAIWYRALTNYLTPTSNLTDGAVAVLQAAEDLYGTAGDWAAIESAVCSGFDDVGLDAGCGGSTPGPTHDGEYLYLYNPDAAEIYPFFMPDTHYFDQYAAAVRFTPPVIAGLKVVGIHFGIAYCWTMSDMDMYLGSTVDYMGETYPDTAFALYTIPNEDLWIAVADTSYVVTAMFDEAVTSDFFAVAYCPDSDPHPPIYDFVLTAFDDAIGSGGDGNRNITTDTEADWVTMDYWWGEDYNLLMAASITYPGADAPELLFPNCPVTFALHSPTPNPFNSEVTIEYSTPFADAKLEVFDLTGRKVTSLVSGEMSIGVNRVVWDGTDIDGATVASGTYLVKLSSGIWKQTQKVTLVK